jgi:hypothetical protein
MNSCLTTSHLPPGIQRDLVTVAALVRRLLAETTATPFNPDTCGYARDRSSIEGQGPQAAERHHRLQVYLLDGNTAAEGFALPIPTCCCFWWARAIWIA